MKFAPISVFFHRGDPLVVEIPQPKLVTKSADFSKISKKNFFFFFFSQVLLRPAHYTLGTLLRPKSPKKQELGCFEHLEFIPQPFSAPPVHFVWASALSKNRKISKKKFFFSGKFRPLRWVFGHQKMQKNAKIGCFDHLWLHKTHFCVQAYTNTVVIQGDLYSGSYVAFREAIVC